MTQNKEAVLRYLQPEHGTFILCTWRIEGVPWKIIEEVRDWVDEKIHLTGPRIWIKRRNPDEYPADIRVKH